MTIGGGPVGRPGHRAGRAGAGCEYGGARIPLRNHGALDELRAELDELRDFRIQVFENMAANPHLRPRPEVLEAIDRQLPRLGANVAEEEAER